MSARQRLAFFLLVCCVIPLAFLRPRSADRNIGPQPDGSVLVPTNQMVTPIGTVRNLPGTRPKDLALAPDGSLVAVLTTRSILLFSLQGEPVQEVPFSASATGIVFAPDGKTLYASRQDGQVAQLTAEEGTWRVQTAWDPEEAATRRNRPPGQPANPQPTGLAVAPDGQTLCVALGIRNAVTLLDTRSGAVRRTIPVDVAPYALAITPDGKTLLVANRGGPLVEGRDTELSAGSRIRVDRQTDAAKQGTLALIDCDTGQTRTLPAGRQPCAIALTPDGRMAAVASSDDDTISLIDLTARRIIRTISLRPREDPGFGQIPTDVAFNSTGDTLYVTCGGINAVAVVQLNDRRPSIVGYVPTAWYPIALACAPDDRLLVASAKGIGARNQRSNGAYGVHDSVGTLQFLQREHRTDLPALTAKVAQNNRWGQEPPPRRDRPPVPVPERVGEPSLFRYVIYIIKENLTYDSVLGDMPEGNGDSKLCLFPEEVSPNHHALAREFILLDSVFSSGTNSADGHQWTSSSIANGYVEQNYAAHVRSYPYDGGDPLAHSPAGFLWTAVVRHKLSCRVYGEFVDRPRIVDTTGGSNPTFLDLWKDYKSGTQRFQITAETSQVALRPLLHPRYIGFPSIVSDQWRADQFLADLKQWERRGEMPRLCILLLPNDHTAGTRPGMPTPRAAVADNDLALGRIVDALSHSRFWKEMLILVVEDDTQLGLDHVDGHRMPAFCISPYTRRGIVSSAPYNHTSFVRTIGLVLGFPALNRFDRTATPLTDCFTSVPDRTPYRVRPNRIPLDEINPPERALRGEARHWATASRKLDLSDVDRADATIVARAVWHHCKPGTPFPWAHFRPNTDD